MPLILNATPGASDANSYLTLLEAKDYFAMRLPLAGWDDADNQSMLLIMATRILDAISSPLKTLMPPLGRAGAYYRVRPEWTGKAATTTQRLAWPRIGMFDRNGNPIDPAVIPLDLKYAVAEFAGQLGVADRTLDNDVIVQGLTAIRAGSVSLSFASDITPQVLPDAVYNLMPLSWLTDELYQAVQSASFEML